MNIRLNACYMLMLLAVCLVSAPFNQSANAEGVIRKPQFDPNAERVELFKGIEEGSIDYIMVMKDMNNGNLILENKTDKTITVEMPAAVAGIHVLPQTFNQIGGGGGGFGGNQGGGLGGQNGGGLGGGQGGGQGVGGGGQGGFGGNQGGGGGFGGQGGGGQGGGGGFFSIPAGKKFLYPLHTVCLEYGKPNPNVKATYKLIKIEEFTKDEAVIQLVKMVGSNQIDTGTAQASAWYLSSKKPWHELAALRMGKLPQTRDIPVFSQEQLSKAQYLVSVAEGKAREEIEKKKNNPEAATTTPAQPASPRLQLKK